MEEVADFGCIWDVLIVAEIILSTNCKRRACERVTGILDIADDCYQRGPTIFSTLTSVIDSCQLTFLCRPGASILTTF